MSAEDMAQRLWPTHKLSYNICFGDLDDERRHLNFFKGNHLFIENHNSTNKKYHYCRHNQLSHWSHDEYVAWLTLKRGVHTKKLQETETEKTSLEIIDTEPPFVNWQAQGKVTSVKNQGKCGGCWAFSATAAIESGIAIKNGDLVNLSEQQLIDCSTDNHGCNGGWPAAAFQYVEGKGLMREVDYPYKAMQDSCKYDPTKELAHITGHFYVKPDDLSVINACATIGPLSIGINASSRSFQFYGGGIYYDPNVLPYPLDHAVLLAGYGQQNDVDFWYVKNSWGTGWGELGYIYIRRNNDNYLGVTTSATYPII